MKIAIIVSVVVVDAVGAAGEQADAFDSVGVSHVHLVGHERSARESRHRDRVLIYAQRRQF